MDLLLSLGLTGLFLEAVLLLSFFFHCLTKVHKKDILLLPIISGYRDVYSSNREIFCFNTNTINEESFSFKYTFD